jgi:probable rRNA maturation factor
MAISFLFNETNISLPERTRLKTFIQGFFKANRKRLDSLTYIFCTDDYLLDINQQFLQHDYYTDIITFNLSDKVNTIQGEIYISIDRVKENARDRNITLKQEIHRVIFHGVLHLCGYKDKSPTQKAEMRAAEDKCLRAYLK